MRLSEARLKNLQWIADRQPIGWFDATGPSLRQVKNFERDGLIERAAPPRNFQLVKYRLTEAGRLSLHDGRE